jgi:hypothetical protein
MFHIKFWAPSFLAPRDDCEVKVMCRIYFPTSMDSNWWFLGTSLTGWPVNFCVLIQIGVSGWIWPFVMPVMGPFIHIQHFPRLFSCLKVRFIWVENTCARCNSIMLFSSCDDFFQLFWKLRRSSMESYPSLGILCERTWTDCSAIHEFPGLWVADSMAKKWNT